MTAALRLDHRTVIAVAGIDAEAFLQGIITQATQGMPDGERRYGALLTPQGKVIADMIIARGPEGFLLDVGKDAAPAVLKRLTLSKLRAQVAITAREDLAVFAFDGAPDPRSADAPTRSIAPRTRASTRDFAEYEASRIAAGLAEMPGDFKSEQLFPADINMDLLDGIDFRKGCFVGQEVVSRMKRRGVARRRTLVVETALATMPTPSPVLAGGFEIGELTSSAAGLGLARVRIDRMADAEAKGETFTAAGEALSFRKPHWLAGELDALKEAKAG
jgi:folate-binding protein YgfZ